LKPMLAHSNSRVGLIGHNGGAAPHNLNVHHAPLFRINARPAEPVKMCGDAARVGAQSGPKIVYHSI
jgi:hypothetical protein